MPFKVDLGIVLSSGDYHRAHTAFLVAAGAAALDRSVVVFAISHGVGALCRNWSLLRGADEDAVLGQHSVAGLQELRNVCQELGVRLVACPSALQAASLNVDMLVQGAVCDGISSFLEMTTTAQLLSF